jgi:hypothetical protein
MSSLQTWISYQRSFGTTASKTSLASVSTTPSHIFFDFSSTRPVVLSKLRDVAYLSARALVHIELQRRCITHYEEHKQDDWTQSPLCQPSPSVVRAPSPQSRPSGGPLYDMTLGHHDGKFSWAESNVTLPHRAWMSHVFVYHTWHEGPAPDVVLDFVNKSMILELPNDAVIADCFFIIGLTLGVHFHGQKVRFEFTLGVIR